MATIEGFEIVVIIFGSIVGGALLLIGIIGMINTFREMKRNGRT